MGQMMPSWLRIMLFASGLLLAALSVGCGGASGPLAKFESGAPVPSAAQSQADGIAQPQVDPRLQAELAAELERVLELYPPRMASSPPEGSASATVLSWDEEQGTFQWRYYSAGDYDQNGEVGVSDLTPLGLNFGKTSGGGGPFISITVESVVDGDQNGEIGVSDVTPVGQNFGVRSQGYRLYFSADEGDVPQSAAEANGAGSQRVVELPLSEATGTPADRKLFSYTPAEAPPEGYYWVRPYDGLELGVPSNAVQAAPPTPKAPTAVLEASPTTGPAALAVVYDASNSNDADGEIVSYEWDFDQSGSYAYDSGTEPTATFYYYEPGTYSTNVRVTDDDGMSAVSIAVEVTVEPGAEWHDVTVPAPNIATQDESTALAQVAGAPAIAFNTTNEGSPAYGLNYILASDPGGAAWGDPVSIQETDDQQFVSISIAVVESRPAIVATIKGASNATYVRAENSTGASWPEPVTVSVALGETSFAIISGLPALSAENKFRRALDLGGEEWGSPPKYATGSFIAADASPDLCEVAGRPAVSFYANGRLAYVRAYDAAGENWGIATIVDDQDTSAGGSRLLVVDGHPAIAYYYPTLGTLKYVRALDPEGTSWGEPLTLALAYEAPYGLILVDGRPAILYADQDADLSCLIANDPAGASWGFPTQVTTSYAMSPSFALVNESPAVCFVFGNPDAELCYSAYY